MKIYDSYEDIPKGCGIKNILLDNISTTDNLYPLLNESIEVFDCVFINGYGIYSYYTTSDGTDKVNNILNNDNSSIICYFIPISYATNRTEKLKRILFD
jgi:hypothetical protein